jgi:elongation factor P--(R)-beta-lysine ligase
VNTIERYKTDEKYRRNIGIRQKVMESIRDFFASEGFTEAEPPMLVRSPGMEPNLSPFKTRIFDEKGRASDGFLITSPEYSCKKMLAAGLRKVYSLGKSFRNGEEFGGTHNPEFTMLEWYRAGEDYTKAMGEIQQLVDHCRVAVGAPAIVDFRGKKINLAKPWRRVSMKELFSEVGIDLDSCLTRETMAEAAKRKGYDIFPGDTFDDCFFKIFLTEIEPKVTSGDPVIIYDYPIQMTALSKPKEDDPRYAERFEAYAGGIELCNAFSELTDSSVARARLDEEHQERLRLGKDDYPLDEDFIASLADMPPATGNALGVDRLVMLLTGAESIDDVILFPASELFGNK